MPKLIVQDLVRQIGKLGTNRTYDYYSGSTRLRIRDILGVEGPITFYRWSANAPESTAKTGTITTPMLGTVAAVFSGKPNYPIHLDRLFSAGGNARSALETLLVNTPNFYICYPRKSNPYTGEAENNKKHVMWKPDEPHPPYEPAVAEYSQTISEIELGTDFGEIRVTPDMLGSEFHSIEAKTTHTQMQVALVKIGNALNFQTWIASNDRSLIVGNTPLGSLDGVVQTLDDVKILYTEESKRAASLIDCIWFDQDFKYMPAVMEVEHSTGVTSGMTRMLKLRETIPSIETKFTIVAPDTLRNKVVSETNNSAFSRMNGNFMSYSTVRELYGLIQKYSLSDVVQREFIDPFIERVKA